MGGHDDVDDVPQVLHHFGELHAARLSHPVAALHVHKHACPAQCQLQVVSTLEHHLRPFSSSRLILVLRGRATICHVSEMSRVTYCDLACTLCIAGKRSNCGSNTPSMSYGSDPGGNNAKASDPAQSHWFSHTVHSCCIVASTSGAVADLPKVSS